MVCADEKKKLKYAQSLQRKKVFHKIFPFTLYYDDDDGRQHHHLGSKSAIKCSARVRSGESCSILLTG